jgi:hypothetical protein
VDDEVAGADFASWDLVGHDVADLVPALRVSDEEVAVPVRRHHRIAAYEHEGCRPTEPLRPQK